MLSAILLERIIDGRILLERITDGRILLERITDSIVFNERTFGRAIVLESKLCKISIKNFHQ